MNLIAVIDLGTGNLRSVSRALEKVAGAGHEVRVSASAPDIAAADRVVFPGQSAIGSCMKRLRDDPPLHEALLEAIASRPFLGLCIGLQALYTRSSEDGGVTCLDILRGECQHFLEAGGAERSFVDPDTGGRLKIPHMGWNTIRRTRGHPLWRGIDQDAWFYFVHSYCAISADQAEVCGTTTHGIEFTAAAGRDNLFAVQFHPEKSQRNGLELLRNFIHWDGSP